MVNQFITPNWHPMFLHYPIALLMLGVLIEIFTFAVPRGGLRAAGRWMMLLGSLLAIPTVVLGIYAFRSVVVPGDLEPGLRWQQVVQASPWSAEQWDFAKNHIWFNSFAVVLFVVATVFWLAGSDNWRRSARLPLLLVMLVGVGLMSVGGWYGGELVYRFGTGVVAAPTPPAGETLKHDVAYYIPPLQLHLALAGFVGAIVIAAFGLMIRRWQLDSMSLVPLSREPYPVTPGVPSEGEPIGPAERAELRSDLPHGRGRPVVAPAKVYPGWFWLTAFVLAIGTALAGAWSVLGVFTREALEHNWEELQEADHRRLAVHVIFGVSIIVLSLVLAGLVRFARRWKVLAGILGSLALLLIGGQIWLGTLMLYDAHSGPPLGFAEVSLPAAPPTQPQGEPRPHLQPSPPPAAQQPPAPPPPEPAPQEPPPPSAPQESPPPPPVEPAPQESLPAPAPGPIQNGTAPYEEIGV
jgi:uncharacterized membrane protein